MAEMTEYTPSEYAYVRKGLWLRRDWIARAYLDGTIMRIDGLIEKGDPDRLVAEGLIK